MPLMRFLFPALLLFLLLPAQAPAQGWSLAPLKAEEAREAREKSRTPHGKPEAAPLRHAVYHVQRQKDGREHELHLLLLNRERSTLRVIDLARSPTPDGAPPMRRVAEGLQRAGAVAGVNGGYFQPGHAPLGLVIREGREEHPFQSSRILTGVFIVTPRGASLLRTAEFRNGFRKGAYKGAPVREALQAGPFLVDKGLAVPGLNATRPAERTVLLADRKGVAALLVTPPMTLADAGELLATPGLFPGLKIERALNLDGGSSTAMWVEGGREPGLNGPNGFSRSEWKRVRNAIGVMPLSTPAPASAP